MGGPFEELSPVVQEVHIRGNVHNEPTKIVAMFCERLFRLVKHKTGLVIIKPGRRPQFASVKTINETARVKGSIDLSDAALQKPTFKKRGCWVLLRNRYGVIGLHKTNIKRSVINPPDKKGFGNPDLIKMDLLKQSWR